MSWLATKDFGDALLSRFGMRAMSYRRWVDLRSNSIGHVGLLEATQTFIRLKQDGLAMPRETEDFLDFCLSLGVVTRSQWSQDLFVLYSTNERRGGTFLEAGAADGYTHSNTFALELDYEWYGTLVEPDPGMFRECRHVRSSRNHFLNAALDPHGVGGHRAQFSRVRQLSHLTGYSGRDSQHDTRQVARRRSMVDLISLSNVLETMREVDYVSLDLEGAEVDVIASLTWNRIAPPKLFTIECNFRKDDEERLRAIMKGQGYSVFADGCSWLTRGDLWFRHEDYF